MKKSIVFIVFGLMLVPVFILAQEYDYTSQTGQGNVNNNPQSGTGVVDPQPLPNASDYNFNLETGEGNVNNNPGSGTVLVPSAPGRAVPAGGQAPVTDTGGQAPTTGSQSQTNIAKLENPLGSRVNSLTGLFIKLVNIVVNISYAVVAFFLILSGFKFVVAQGKPQEIESAKKTFWYTIVGGLIIVGAQTIARILEELVKNL
ncbi:MAG TPA: pilin [Candidatus Paceibacterota bacterium]|nr:pilin [Candidatus Paceibacterota bacterium]